MAVYHDRNREFGDSMTISIQLPEKQSLKPSITVFGVGGGGGNAVNNMIATELEGVSFVVANTDAQALEESLCKNHIQLGASITQGLGAGSYPEVGKASAEEAVDEILDYLQGSNMVFITAGLGGGTGTGAAPVVARLAKERGILTVAVVTKPFNFEGTHRMRVAELGLDELQKYVDTLIVIPNQNLFRVADKNTTFLDAFKLADDVLHAGVRGVTDLMTMPGLINLDFSDVRSVMSEMGKAMMGTGEATGEGRAVHAAEAAIANPLLDNVSMQGARGVLINITGGYDMTLFEVDEAANRIKEEVDPDANIIFGSTFNKEAEGTIRVSVVATGIDLALESVRLQGEGLQKPSLPTYTVVDNTGEQELTPPNEASDSVQEQPAAQAALPLDATQDNAQPATSSDSMLLSDVLERNVKTQKEEEIFASDEMAGSKDAPFIAPEPQDPAKFSDEFDKHVSGSASSMASVVSEKEPVNENAHKDELPPLTLPDGIFEGSASKSNNSGGIFGGLFGGSRKKDDDVITTTPASSQGNPESQPATQNNNKDSEDLDIPAFLRRK